MRKLVDITDAARRNEKPTYDELLYAVCAYDVMLAQIKIENHPVLLAEFFKAGESDPKIYIGTNNDPNNTECNEWHKAFVNVGETKETLCNSDEQCGECESCSVFCDVCGTWYWDEDPCELH